jgi:membrane-bound ClpP family serine protease
VDGELWTATTEGPSVEKDALVEVVAVEGLRLRVRPLPAATEGAAPVEANVSG